MTARLHSLGLMRTLSAVRWKEATRRRRREETSLNKRGCSPPQSCRMSGSLGIIKFIST